MNTGKLLFLIWILCLATLESRGANLSCSEAFSLDSSTFFSFTEARTLLESWNSDPKSFDYSRIDLRPPHSKQNIQATIDLSIREKVNSGLPAESFTVPVVKLRRVLDHATGKVGEGDADTYFLGELSNGQVVLLTPQFRSSADRTVRISESFYAQLQMAKVGALDFAVVGRSFLGEYFGVLPLHRPMSSLSNYKVDNIADVMVLFRQIDLLKEADIPFLKQSLDWQTASRIHMGAGSLFKGGDYQFLKMKIYSLLDAGARPLDVTDRINEIQIRGKLGNGNHPFSMGNLLKFNLFQNVPYRLKVDFIDQRLREGHLREVFALLYLDMRFPERHQFELYFNSLKGEKPPFRVNDSEDFWSHTHYEARADHKASVEPQGWVSGKSLRQHFKSHGPEFGVESKESYLELASEFFMARDEPSIIVRQQGSGQYFKYNFETNELGVLTPNREIITYYRLDPKFRPLEEFEGSLADQLLD